MILRNIVVSHIEYSMILSNAGDEFADELHNEYMLNYIINYIII